MMVVVAAIASWPSRRASRGRTAPDSPEAAPPDAGQTPGGAGRAPVAASPAADGRVRVAGTVTDRLTHGPVPDAEVVFTDGDSESSATTDLAGTYHIALRAGRYRAFVRGGGVISMAPRASRWLPARPRPDQVAALRLELAPELELRESTAGIDLEVDRAGAIHGRVVDRTGQPIAGAIVRAFAVNGGANEQPVLGNDVAETDSAGVFDLEVAASDHRLVAFHDHHGGVRTMVSVVAGEIVETEITMPAGCVIAGRVVRADGKPVSGGALERAASGTDDQGRYTPAGELADDGSFAWSTTEAMTLFLRARPWRSPPSQALRFECKPGARYAGVTLVVPDAAPDLSGRVVTANGSPVPFADISVVDESGSPLNRQERADADGNWAIYSLSAGPYRLAVAADRVGAMATRVTAPADKVQLRMPGTGALVGRVSDIVDGLVMFTARACIVDDVALATEFRQLVRVVSGSYSLDGVPACHLNVQVDHRGKMLFLDTVVAAGRTTTLDLDFDEESAVASDE